MAGDPRALPILRKALDSKNFLIQSMGAQGLAVLRDKASIPRIIDVSKRAANLDTNYGSVVGMALAFFDDAAAQQAADKLIPDKGVRTSYREKFRSIGPRGLFH